MPSFSVKRIYLALLGAVINSSFLWWPPPLFNGLNSCASIRLPAASQTPRNSISTAVFLRYVHMNMNTYFRHLWTGYGTNSEVNLSSWSSIYGPGAPGAESSPRSNSRHGVEYVESALGYIQIQCHPAVCSPYWSGTQKPRRFVLSTVWQSEIRRDSSPLH